MERLKKLFLSKREKKDKKIVEEKEAVQDLDSSPVIEEIKSDDEVEVTTDENNKNRVFRIGILGAAKIAPSAIIDPALKLDNCEIYGIAARDKEKASKFATKHNIPKVFDTYEDLINDSEIDIIFNPLPNGLHAHYSILALQKGKYVLCEKPLSSNTNEVDKIIEALSNAPINLKTKKKPIIIEAFHDKFHPLTLKIRQMIEKNELGDLNEILIKMTIPWFKLDKKDIRFNINGTKPELGGGMIMDVGCYATSIYRNFAGVSLSKDFTTFPEFEIKEAKIEETFKTIKGVDKSATTKIEMYLKTDISKKVKGDIEVGFKNWRFNMKYILKGSKKTITVTNPLSLHRNHTVTEVDLISKKTNKWTEYGDKNTTYFYQLKSFIGAIEGNEDDIKLCEWAGGMKTARENMRMIDQIYIKAGSKPRIGKVC